MQNTENPFAKIGEDEHTEIDRVANRDMRMGG